MPRGLGAIAAARQAAETRRASGGGGAGLYLKIESGQTITVRFLEGGDDFVTGYFHKVPDGSQYGKLEVCTAYDEDGNLSRPCELHDKYPKVSFRGFANVIWRDAPDFERDSEGKIVKGADGKPKVIGYRDQVALWDKINEDTTYALADIDAKYGGAEKKGGLKSRDFEITRNGTGMDTTYTILPADVDGGPQPMSEADEKLAEGKYDLNERVAKPSPKPAGGGGSPVPTETSPFMRGRS